MATSMVSGCTVSSSVQRLPPRRQAPVTSSDTTKTTVSAASGATVGCGTGNHRDHQGHPDLCIVHAPALATRPLCLTLHLPTPQSPSACLKWAEDHNRRMTAPAAVSPCLRSPRTARVRGRAGAPPRDRRGRRRASCRARQRPTCGASRLETPSRSATSRSAGRAARRGPLSAPHRASELLEPSGDRSRQTGRGGLPHFRGRRNLSQLE